MERKYSKWIYWGENKDYVINIQNPHQTYRWRKYLGSDGFNSILFEDKSVGVMDRNKLIKRNATLEEWEQFVELLFNS